MPPRGHVHDRAVLDALESIDPESFEGEVWRVTRKNRDPLRGSIAHGRWSPGAELEVLYACLEREGALAEIGYRLSLEPVWPSRLRHQIHLIKLTQSARCALPMLPAYLYSALTRVATQASTIRDAGDRSRRAFS